jgi:hypothetical protein
MEMLVRIQDRTNDSEPEKTNSLTQAGDVIVVRPDGWLWGEKELNSTAWRIIKCPGEPMSVGEQFLGPEIVDTNVVLNPKPRAVKIDLSAIKGTTATAAELGAAKVVKSATVSDDVIGLDTKVL